MVTVIASIVINHSVEKVCEFMTDPNNRLKYDPELLDVCHSPEGPLSLGSQIVEVRKMTVTQ